MKKNFSKTLIIACAFALIGANFAQAEEKPTTYPQNTQQGIMKPTTFKYIGEAPTGKKTHAKGNKPTRIEDKLNLSEEQKAQIQKNKEEYKQKAQPIKEQIKTKHQELKKLKTKQNPSNSDKQKIEKLQGEIKELNLQMRDLVVENQNNFEAVLNENQKQTLEKMRKQQAKQMQKRKKAFEKKKKQAQKQKAKVQNQNQNN